MDTTTSSSSPRIAIDVAPRDPVNACTPPQSLVSQQSLRHPRVPSMEGLSPNTSFVTAGLPARAPIGATEKHSDPSAHLISLSNPTPSSTSPSAALKAAGLTPEPSLTSQWSAQFSNDSLLTTASSFLSSAQPTITNGSFVTGAPTTPPHGAAMPTTVRSSPQSSFVWDAALQGTHTGSAASSSPQALSKWNLSATAYTCSATSAKESDAFSPWPNAPASNSPTNPLAATMQASFQVTSASTPLTQFSTFGGDGSTLQPHRVHSQVVVDGSLPAARRYPPRVQTVRQRAATFQTSRRPPSPPSLSYSVSAPFVSSHVAAAFGAQGTSTLPDHHHHHGLLPVAYVAHVDGWGGMHQQPATMTPVTPQGSTSTAATSVEQLRQVQLLDAMTRTIKPAVDAFALELDRAVKTYPMSVCRRAERVAKKVAEALQDRNVSPAVSPARDDSSSCTTRTQHVSAPGTTAAALSHDVSLMQLQSSHSFGNFVQDSSANFCSVTSVSTCGGELADILPSPQRAAASPIVSLPVGTGSAFPSSTQMPLTMPPFSAPCFVSIDFNQFGLNPAAARPAEGLGLDVSGMFTGASEMLRHLVDGMHQQRSHSVAARGVPGVSLLGNNISSHLNCRDVCVLKHAVGSQLKTIAWHVECFLRSLLAAAAEDEGGSVPLQAASGDASDDTDDSSCCTRALRVATSNVCQALEALAEGLQHDTVLFGDEANEYSRDVAPPGAQQQQRITDVLRSLGASLALVDATVAQLAQQQVVYAPLSNAAQSAAAALSELEELRRKKARSYDSLESGGGLVGDITAQLQQIKESEASITQNRLLPLQIVLDSLTRAPQPSSSIAFPVLPTMWAAAPAASSPQLHRAAPYSTMTSISCGVSPPHMWPGAMYVPPSLPLCLPGLPPSQYVRLSEIVRRMSLPCRQHMSGWSSSTASSGIASRTVIFAAVFAPQQRAAPPLMVRLLQALCDVSGIPGPSHWLVEPHSACLLWIPQALASMWGTLRRNVAALRLPSMVSQSLAPYVTLLDSLDLVLHLPSVDVHEKQLSIRPGHCEQPTNVSAYWQMHLSSAGGTSSLQLLANCIGHFVGHPPAYMEYVGSSKALNVWVPIAGRDAWMSWANSATCYIDITGDWLSFDGVMRCAAAAAQQQQHAFQASGTSPGHPAAMRQHPQLLGGGSSGASVSALLPQLVFEEVSLARKKNRTRCGKTAQGASKSVT